MNFRLLAFPCTCRKLPSDEVLQILETSGGTIWVSTSRGLAWFDGFQWHKVDSSHGLVSKGVLGMTGIYGKTVILNNNTEYYLADRRGITAGWGSGPIRGAGGTLLGSGITLVDAVKNLLAHTSGYSEAAGLVNRTGQGTDDGALERNIRRLAGTPLDHPIGQFQYSNANYDALGYLVAVVARK